MISSAIYSGGAGLLVAAGCAIWALVERLRAARAETESRLSALRLASVVDSLNSATVRAHEEGTRYEAIIRSLKHEIREAEAALANCTDPAVVGDRLRRLLSPVPRSEDGRDALLPFDASAPGSSGPTGDGR